MKTILVTGPIGGGKSTVCRYLESKGYPVYDCDSRTKRLYGTVPGLKSRIETALGITWDEIGVIFKDEAKRLSLEAIVYPLLVEDINAWKKDCRGPLAFIESAIALDKRQFDGMYDDVILVEADYSLREGRNPNASVRNALQTFDKTKVGHMIENNSTLDSLFNKTEEILCRLI